MPGSTSDIGYFDHAMEWEMAHTHDAALFLIQSDSRLSRRLVLSTTAHFHLER